MQLRTSTEAIDYINTTRIQRTTNQRHGGTSSLALQISVMATIIDPVTLNYILYTICIDGKHSLMLQK